MTYQSGNDMPSATGGPGGQGRSGRAGAGSRGSSLASTLRNIKDILTSVYGIITVVTSILAIFGAGAYVGHAAASAPAPTPTITVIKSAPASPAASPAGGASVSPQSSSEPSSAGVAYLSLAQPIESSFYSLTNGPIQINTTIYQRSVEVDCGSETGMLVYNVAGYNFLSATVGVPNDASGAAGNSATIAFFKNGSSTELGTPITATLGQQQQVHLNLQGAEQLEITCMTPSGAMDIALGNAAIGPS
jgi:hypothetical protein